MRYFQKSTHSPHQTLSSEPVLAAYTKVFAHMYSLDELRGGGTHWMNGSSNIFISLIFSSNFDAIYPAVLVKDKD